MLGILAYDERYKILHQTKTNSILSMNLLDYYNVDTLLLPMAGIDSSGYIKGSTFYLEDILKNNKVRIVYVGKSNSLLQKYSLAYHFEIVELLKDEQFVHENASLTAKGMLHILEDEKLDLIHTRILILGFGNIAVELAKLFTCFSLDFDIYTENQIERKFLYAMKYKYKKELHTISEYNLIINTIPNNISINYEELTKIKVYDLASSPYGFNPLEIEKYNIDYTILGNLPAYYNPKTASIILNSYIKD